MGAKELPAECAAPRAGMPSVPMKVEKIISAIAPEKPSGEVLENTRLFNQYCVRCHGSPDAVVPLPLNDLTKLKVYRTDEGLSVLQMLETQRMPPETASKPSASERATMLELLK